MMSKLSLLEEYKLTDSFVCMMDIHERYIAELENCVQDETCNESYPFDEATFQEWKYLAADFNDINERIAEIILPWMDRQYTEYAKFKAGRNKNGLQR